RTVSLAFGPRRELLVGEVLGAQVREGIIDPLSLNVDFAALAPVGRLCGAAYAARRVRAQAHQLRRVASRAPESSRLDEGLKRIARRRSPSPPPPASGRAR